MGDSILLIKHFRDIFEKYLIPKEEFTARELEISHDINGDLHSLGFSPDDGDDISNCSDQEIFFGKIRYDRTRVLDKFITNVEICCVAFS